MRSAVRRQRGMREMRVCLKVQIPVESGNKAISDGKLQPMLEEWIDSVKPEAAYFFPQDGMRTMMIFFEMKENSQMPVVGEPLFEQLNAKIDVTPAMNLDDLMAGMKKLQNHR
jgi:hypothetical protein